jgi:hypothetical protein
MSTLCFQVAQFKAAVVLARKAGVNEYLMAAVHQQSSQQGYANCGLQRVN